MSRWFLLLLLLLAGVSGTAGCGAAHHAGASAQRPLLQPLRRQLLSSEAAGAASAPATAATVEAEQPQQPQQQEQGVHASCGTPLPTPQQAAAEYAAVRAAAAADAAAAAGQLPASVVVPLYWHVVQASDAAASALADDVIARQVQVLNDAFQARGASAGSAPTRYSFRLCRVDRTTNNAWYYSPAERDFGGGGLVQPEPAAAAMKRSTRRGGAHALNVWSHGAAGNAGYATFPIWYAEAPALDGVSLNVSALPVLALERGGGNTLTHEVGHWLSLYHVFQGGCQADEAQGDQVADTPAQAQVASRACDDPNKDSCPNLPGKDLTNNFMDYIYDTCRTTFTLGQADRIDLFWEAYRHSDWVAQTVTAVDDTASTPAGVPVAIRVLANDVATMADELQVVTNPAGSACVVDVCPQHGALSVGADGVATYTPEPGFSGQDSFVYRAQDCIKQSAPARVTVDVTLAPMELGSPPRQAAPLCSTVPAAGGQAAAAQDCTCQDSWAADPARALCFCAAQTWYRTRTPTDACRSAWGWALRPNLRSDASATYPLFTQPTSFSSTSKNRTSRRYRRLQQHAQLGESNASEGAEEAAASDLSSAAANSSQACASDGCRRCAPRACGPATSAATVGSVSISCRALDTGDAAVVFDFTAAPGAALGARAVQLSCGVLPGCSPQQSLYTSPSGSITVGVADVPGLGPDCRCTCSGDGGAGCKQLNAWVYANSGVGTGCGA